MHMFQYQLFFFFFLGVWLWNEENSKQDTSIYFALLWSIIGGMYLHFLTKERWAIVMIWNNVVKNRNAKLLEKIGLNWFYNSFLNELICNVGYRDWQGIDEYTLLTSNIPNFQCQQKLNKNGYALAAQLLYWLYYVAGQSFCWYKKAQQEEAIVLGGVRGLLPSVDRWM